MITEFAPAKINLCLHVTGRRADGYHLLSSLVAFADCGDRITARAADRLSLEIDGPFGAALSAEADNLVLRAAGAFGAGAGAALRLEKNLPVASGLGGGSADAAATLRALAALWGAPMPEALALGADVPVCLAGRACVMEGIGERLRPYDGMPPAPIVLVNPGIALSTPAVFGARQAEVSPALPALPDRFDDVAALASWLAQTRNDLEAPAQKLAPEISTVLAALAAQPGALLARMSGSGATCFALFQDKERASEALARLKRDHPHYWLCQTQFLTTPESDSRPAWAGRPR